MIPDHIPAAPVIMGAALTACVLIFSLVLWVLNRRSDNTFDLSDLICSDGRVDERKFCRFGAWIVSTWGFVYLIADQRFSEWYFTGYMAAWVGNALLAKYLSDKAAAPK